MNWFALALFGGLVGIDATSFPQVMISRPIVAAILGGLAAGHPGVGAAFGIILEVFHLAVLPIGASRYPEAGTAAAAGAFALAAVEPTAGPAALLLALGFALLWGRVAAGSVEFTRRTNATLMRAGEPGVTATALEVRHMAAMAVDFARGGVVTLAGALVGWGLLLAASGRGSEIVARGGLAIVMAGAAAGALTVFGGLSERRVSFFAGAGLGILILWLT